MSLILYNDILFHKLVNFLKRLKKLLVATKCYSCFFFFFEKKICHNSKIITYLFIYYFIIIIILLLYAEVEIRLVDS